jgi:hypothetical protein
VGWPTLACEVVIIVRMVDGGYGFSSSVMVMVWAYKACVHDIQDIQDIADREIR